MSEDIIIEDKRLERLLLPEATLEKLWTGTEWGEGPVWWDDGSVTWSDIPKNRILQWHPNHGSCVFREPSNHANGHTRDRQGRLISCENSGRRITRTEPDGSVTTLVDRFNGRRLNSPNDVIVKSDGTIWFSDPPCGTLCDPEGLSADSEIGANHVYRFDPSTDELGIVGDEFAKPNGLAFSPDEKLLYVSDAGSSQDPREPHHIRVFDVEDGRVLKNGRIFAVIEPGASDGFCLDWDGNLFISSHDGIQVYAPDGIRLGRILVPEVIANCTFGGPCRDRLFITAAKSLYAIDVATRGATWPLAWT